MAILSCTSPTHLEATRRRMGIAISSKKYRAQKEERRSGGRVSGQACGGVPGSKSNHLEQASKVEVSEPSAGMTPSELKRERRAQLKAEVEEEFIEALDILEDEGKAVAASSESSCMESSWNPSRPPLELHEVASMKRERRRAADAEYEHVRRPQWSVVVLEDGCGGGGVMDGHMDAVDEWEMLESQSDGGVNSVPYSSTKTFAEVVAGDV